MIFLFWFKFVFLFLFLWTLLYNRSNGSCRVDLLFTWVVLGLKNLTLLAKQIVSGLTINEFTGQMG